MADSDTKNERYLGFYIYDLNIHRSGIVKWNFIMSLICCICYHLYIIDEPLLQLYSVIYNIFPTLSTVETFLVTKRDTFSHLFISTYAIDGIHLLYSIIYTRMF